MKLNKITLVSSLCFLMPYLIAALLLGYPLVLDFTQQQTRIPSVHKIGDTIVPFEKFDFDNGRWVAYLLIGKNDMYDLSEKMPTGNCLKTTDTGLLKKMQREWKFTRTQGDMATVESSIIIFCNGINVFSSGIVLSKSLQGLQSNEFGWLESSLLINSCSQFRRVYFPIVILK